MSYPDRTGEFKLGPWPKGINNVDDPMRLGADELQDSNNFILTDEGQANLRPGLVKRVTGTALSGIFRVNDTYGLFFDAGKLYRVNANTWDKKELATGYSSRKYTSWTKIGPRVFFTNGNEHGRVHVPDWSVLSGFGTPNPGLTVTLTALSYGSLPVGRYFVGITYVDALGEESGCPAIHFIELTAVGGIDVALAGTVPSNIDAIRVYLTEVNGKRDELYRVAVLDSTDTGIELTFREFGSPLETLFLDEIPVPDLITSYNGYLFFAINDRVWHSHVLRYGLYHEDHNEVGWYPDEVSVLERGQDGLWVVADITYAYVGASPKEFQLVDNVFDHPAVKFSGAQVEGNLFQQEGLTKDVPLWFSTRGAVVGLPGGQVLPVMKGRAEPDRFRVGVSGTVEFNGVTSVVSALDERKGPGDSVGLQDTFSVKVIKRGLSDE